MDSSSKPDAQFCFEQILPDLQETVTYIGNSTSLKQDHHNKLIWLSKQLTSIKNEVIRVLDVSIDEPHMLSFMEWLAKGKKAYYDLVDIVNKIEPSLSHLLDLVELVLMSPELVNECDGLFDLIEDCTALAVELKVRLNSKMPLLEASLEFDEISKDNIDTLGIVIDTNINQCFEVQEERFTSPVRHPPSFTLKHVVRLLASHTDTAEATIPTFSPIEEVLSRKYLDIKRTVSPISKSLTEILPARIDHFSKRTIIHIDHLTNLLKEKHREVLDKHNIMVKEIRELKRELVDKRWNLLFLNLNHELQSILGEIEHLESKVHDYGNNLEAQDKVKKQLRSKTNIVTKTFNVIYRALEFSLLDVEVASTTNELAQRWLDMRPQSDRVLSASSSFLEESSFDSLSSRFRSLSMGSTETADTEQSSLPPQPARGKFGALLLKKMNIKPVMVTSPTQNDVNNPFLNNLPSPKDEAISRSSSLSMEPVPQLAFKKPEAILERPETPVEKSDLLLERPETPMPDDDITSIVTSIKNHGCLEDLEVEKINYYAQMPSHIPKLQNHASFKFNWRPPEKSNPPWAPYTFTYNNNSDGVGHLLPPTPLKDILMTKTHLLATHDNSFMTKI
ncbi:ZYRO0F00374p [Zygosaccharomyces rouxii]|uniref:ZYRO0F00374p n=1 Tax=Zygosaccharomyces rouxii (strain ATCC 2623 / CBS 732 / NBRC 1130 / NCYC 568 / NRRL Y-229) TaxID=559307 RepID=C5DWX4_ZYGRC|nr:uncharacterized protein ZYRO0F00374g [Zygosaccharomyces rouxii]KAH9199051.1 cortical protein KAR9-domain-containing protein [Zygosaccharomyces rouxii]CAR28285.1 ZYRO0F00374p [Zygosaccharomyces rouxii]